MNNQEVFDRIQAGEYDGTRSFKGVERKEYLPRICRQRGRRIGGLLSEGAADEVILGAKATDISPWPGRSDWWR